MTRYQRGSKGAEVTKIQTRLRELGLYLGPIDGDFGGGTEAAVKAFQRGERLEPDGIVGSATWAALFGGAEIEEPAILRAPLVQRCLALTGTFETGAPIPDCFSGLSGDFDGQGLSFGVLQWNLGQGSLQPLLTEMDQRHPEILEQVFDGRLDMLRAMLRADRDEQLAWARSIQDPLRKTVNEPWRGLFKSLGRRPEFQEIEAEHARATFDSALSLCRTFGVVTERAAALTFDIKVQNGSISPLVEAQIRHDFGGLTDTGNAKDLEVRKLQIIAERRSAAAKPEWVADVRARKMAIALGEGVVHGSRFNLEEQYGIRLTPVT